MNVFRAQDLASIVTPGLIQIATGTGVTPSTAIESWSRSAPDSTGAGQYSVALTYAALQWTTNAALYMNA
ncbi:hypothetical protein P0D88_44565 [Paraburkholderia sp. RL18-103-BIB-C]|uniref:hypothetical protein n=1 Tax=Paraburkholderia sp. RL18-103-BIB-C TaxID=3031637 RepID=UPI0038BD6E1A